MDVKQNFQNSSDDTLAFCLTMRSSQRFHSSWITNIGITPCKQTAKKPTAIAIGFALPR